MKNERQARVVVKPEMGEYLVNRAKQKTDVYKTRYKCQQILRLILRQYSLFIGLQ